MFLEENSTAVMKPVKAGLRQGDYVQITEGLVSGDRLIVFGGTNLNDGDKVSVQ